METAQRKYNGNYLPTLEVLMKVPKRDIFWGNQDSALVLPIEGVPLGITDNGTPLYGIDGSIYAKVPKERDPFGKIIYKLSKVL